ncbi:MAG: helix-turn-helix transcriptional regulator [Magnetococcales bacterium]|nr:helix-turn-helix transcriptional regulator [Magnetococcales bacterium]
MNNHKLKAWRGRMGWSKTDAAKKLGVSRNQYLRYEKGIGNDEKKVKIPQTVALACEALETRPILANLREMVGRYGVEITDATPVQDSAGDPVEEQTLPEEKKKVSKKKAQKNKESEPSIERSTPK